MSLSKGEEISDIDLIIRVPREKYLYAKDLVSGGKEDNPIVLAIGYGIPLPEGHGDIYDKKGILDFLKCSKYEICEWKDCYNCSQSLCINLNNLSNLVPIEGV